MVNGFTVAEKVKAMKSDHIQSWNLRNFLIILLFVSNVCFAEPLNVRTNNAGNITYSRTNQWIGQVGKYKQFVVFDTKDNGLRAMEIVLKSNIRKSNTVTKFVHRYTNESLKHKHIQNYANAIRRHLGREHLYTSDSDKLLPLIVFLEGGEKAFNYYFGVNNVRTINGTRFTYYTQSKIIKSRLQQKRIRHIKCYSLRDVLIPT